jgi:hypothetical protein
VFPFSRFFSASLYPCLSSTESNPLILFRLPPAVELFLDAGSDSELSPLLPVPRENSLGSVCPDSLDAAYERLSSQPSPCAVRKSKLRPSPSPPQSPPRNIATKARSKASNLKKPRTRGLDLSSAQPGFLSASLYPFLSSTESNPLILFRLPPAVELLLEYQVSISTSHLYPQAPTCSQFHTAYPLLAP